MDGPTQPKAPHFTRTSAAQQPEAWGDEDFGMASAISPDDQESFGYSPTARSRSSANVF